MVYTGALQDRDTPMVYTGDYIMCGGGPAGQGHPDTKFGTTNKSPRVLTPNKKNPTSQNPQEVSSEHFERFGERYLEFLT